jgi:hypothetical protein
MWEELPVPKPRKSRKGTATSPAVKEATEIVRKGDLNSDDEEINDFLHFHRKDRK